jgi:transglutaminase-like putative cysteine protease
MSFERLFRASMYLMLFLASMVLSVNAQDYNRFTMLYPLAVAAAGVAAFVTVDRNPKLGLARDLANFLGGGSFILSMMEIWADQNATILALGHWLLYLTLVKMFLPKTVEDDWFLFLLGLVQVVIGVVLSQSSEVGALLMAWALTSLWTLGLFHLHREARHNVPGPGVTVSPGPDRSNPYPGLFNVGFVISTTLVALTTLALGGIIFLLTPRWSATPNQRGVQPMPQNLTGFSEEVRLGRMGEILESDEVVMTVEMADGLGRKVQPSDEPLWRGVTLVDYEEGRWSRSPNLEQSLERAPFGAWSPDRVLRQRIRLEAVDSDVLFALRPFFSVSNHGGEEISMNPIDGTLFRRDRRPNTRFEGPAPNRSNAYDYEILSALTPGGTQPLELYPRSYQEYMPRLRRVPDSIRPQLEEIANKILGDDVDGPVERRARKLEAYFLSGGFYYSLSMQRGDPGLDPVVDFLVNRREGHCEYFASALALLLRSQGIPSRVVNGFKGGDWNAIFGAMTVRQKHAHSWVEALVGRDERGQPVWLTLDATPALQRDQVVAQVGGVSNNFRTFTDAFRQFWVFNVVGFDQERQQRLIYGPIRRVAGMAAVGFGMMYQAIRDALGKLLYFENTREFFSGRGFVVSVATMLLMVGVFFLLRWIASLIWRRFRGPAQDALALASGVAFYHRLTRLLAEAGLERPPGETPREFARRAGRFLSGRVSAGLAEIPLTVVDAFYRVRFGRHTLDPEIAQLLDARLDDLETGLRPRRD